MGKRARAWPHTPPRAAHTRACTNAPFKPCVCAQQAAPPALARPNKSLIPASTSQQRCGCRMKLCCALQPE
eukprot:5844425-Pleurochrysis_carterae.AAC.1